MGYYFVCLCYWNSQKDDEFSFLWEDNKPEEWGVAPLEDGVLRVYISQGYFELKTVSESLCFVIML